LEWLRSNRANKNDEGIIFFADDDNTYSVELFNEVNVTNAIAVLKLS